VGGGTGPGIFPKVDDADEDESERLEVEAGVVSGFLDVEEGDIEVELEFKFEAEEDGDDPEVFAAEEGEEDSRGNDFRK